MIIIEDMQFPMMCNECQIEYHIEGTLSYVCPILNIYTSENNVRYRGKLADCPLRGMCLSK